MRATRQEGWRSRVAACAVDSLDSGESVKPTEVRSTRQVFNGRGPNIAY